MAQVVYFLSTLPHIGLNMPSEGVYEELSEFLSDCQALGDESVEKVTLAVITPHESQLPVAKEWAEFEYSIKNELARRRWQSLRQGTYQSALVHDSVPVSAEALDILSDTGHAQNPYVREKHIIETKWQILESLDLKFQFGLENVIVYGWKLQLYLSYHNLTETRGKAQWNTLIVSLAEKSGFSISSIDGGFNE